MRAVPGLFPGLFPLACPGCGARAEPVCPACAAGLRRPGPAPPPPGCDAWAAALAYEGVGRELVARVKYRNARAVVPWLAAAMVEALGALPSLAGAGRPLVVTWAPTTPARRRSRGFDPAEVLARPVARRLDVPCTALARRLPGPPQTGLAAAARRVAPRVAPAGGAASRRRVAGATVVVVDDVATTGATLAAVAGVVRAHGAARVVALTAARTPSPGSPGV